MALEDCLPADESSVPSVSDLRRLFPGRDLLYQPSEQGYRLMEKTDSGLSTLLDEARLREMESALADEAVYTAPGMITFGLYPARVALQHAPDDVIVCCLEPDLLYFIGELVLYDYTELLSNPNVYLAVGDGFQSCFSGYVRDEALYLTDLRTWIILLGYTLTPEAERHRHAAVDHVTQEATKALESFEHRLNHVGERLRFPDWSDGTRLWACGISRGPEVYSIHLEILRSVLKGYREEGFEVTFEHEMLNRQAADCRLRESYVETEPNCVLMLNAFPDSFLTWIFQSENVSELCPVPRLVWMTDDFVYSPGSEDGFSDLDIVFCVDRTYVDRAKALGAGKAYFLPSAAALSGKGKYRSEYDHPISFVGSVTDLRAELSNLRPAAKEWLQNAASAVIRNTQPEPLNTLDANGQANVVAVAESICPRMGKDYLSGEKALSYALYVIANTYKRVRLVKELIPLGLIVYGNADWENLLGDDVRGVYRGPLPYEELADLYASTKINLNIHSLQCPTCLNPRDYDVTMAGGFLLSEWVPDADEGYFVDGTEAVFFKSTPQMKELAQYYLDHDEERIAIAEAGCDRSFLDHRYENRVRESLNLLRTA